MCTFQPGNFTGWLAVKGLIIVSYARTRTPPTPVKSVRCRSLGFPAGEWKWNNSIKETQPSQWVCKADVSPEHVVENVTALMPHVQLWKILERVRFLKLEVG